jgi:hypothetical protein
MNHFARTVGPIALLMLVILACNDSTSTGPSGPLPPLTVTEFPMEVGSHWVYHVIDTVSGDEDTVDVTITSEQIDSAGKTVTVWQYSYRNDVFQSESVFVSALGDSVWFSYGPSGTPYQTIIFPLSTGKVWWWYLSRCGRDSSMVSGEEIIWTPSGAYRTYRIETETRGPVMDLICSSRLWLSRRVGLVRVIRIRGFWFPESVAIWSLLDYESAGGG